MLSKYARHAAFAATMLELVVAQGGSTVPQDLQEGFRSSKAVQVSYTDEAENGFKDGTEFEKDAVTEEPAFALGDSSAVVPRNRYTILMIDTTCDDARKLHYARTNFKYNFDIVNIESETEPVLSYKAPGAFDETGDDRKYTFLMYGQPQNDEIDDLQLPEEGAVFDVKKFQEDNGFEDPQAGVGMVVKLGGESSCNSETTPANPPSGGQQSSAAASEAESSAAATRTGAGSVPAPTSGQNESVPASPTNPSNVSASSGASQLVPVPTGAPSGLTTEIAPESSADGELPIPVTSTLFLTSDNVAPEAPAATGSQTESTDPAEQTTNSAPGLSFGAMGGSMIGSVMAIAGLLAW